MISLSTNAETSHSKKSNLLSLSGLEGDKKGKSKSKLSFLDLLNGVKIKPEDKALKSTPLKKTLSLKELKKEIHLPKTLSVELNPILTKDIAPKDLKQLIFDAKTYLKKKIVQSDAFKLNEVKQLPKTLKGLVAVANKLGINLKKITLEDVQSVKLTPKDKAFLSKQANVKKGVSFVPHKELKETLKAQVKQELKPPIHEVKKSELKEALKIEPKQKMKSILKVANIELKKTPNVELKQELKKSPKVELKQELKSAPALSTLGLKKALKPQKNPPLESKQDKNIVVKNKVKTSIPLFRELIQVPQKVLTQNIVNVKQQLSVKDKHQDSKTIKQRADETLKLLLRGERPQQSLTTGLTADFSVASSRLIAPQASKDISKSFESLLQNIDEKSVNPDALKIQKVDSFSVKLNEAKQMVQYLSQDIKTAIDDYKSPFMRLKVQLNPQNLGAVDLTIVSRGKNLHVNIGSNNVAINALAMNLNDLKTQLSNNGINNATFNFNGGSNGDAQSQNSQQHHPNQQQASEEYNYFEVQDENEEILNSLEIVVPNYA